MAMFNLPERPGEATVYHDTKTGEMIRVELRRDGTYYGAADKFDTSARSAQEMADKLRGWGFVYAGAEAR